MRKAANDEPMTIDEQIKLIDVRLRDPRTNAAQFTKLHSRRDRLTKAMVSGQRTAALDGGILAGEGSTVAQLLAGGFTEAHIGRMTEAQREIWAEVYRLEKEEADRKKVEPTQ